MNNWKELASVMKYSFEWLYWKTHGLSLFQVLLEWINDELAENRIIVKDLEEDLFDGQILQKLIGKLLILVLEDIDMDE